MQLRRSKEFLAHRTFALRQKRKARECNTSKSHSYETIYVHTYVCTTGSCVSKYVYVTESPAFPLHDSAAQMLPPLLFIAIVGNNTKRQQRLDEQINKTKNKVEANGRRQTKTARSAKGAQKQTNAESRANKGTQRACKRDREQARARDRALFK